MSDDEEVVHKNTGLYSHLREAGFEDFEFLPESNPKNHQAPLKSSEPPIQDNPIYGENRKEDYETYVRILLNSNLVFSDDVQFVQSFAVCLISEPVPSSILTKQFRSSCVSVILDTLAVSTVCFFVSLSEVLRITPRILLTCHAVPISWQCVKYVYTQYHELKRRKILNYSIESMKSLTMLVNKSVRFIKESEISAVNDQRFRIEIINPESKSVENRVIDNFRKTVFSTIRSIILELKEAIIRLTEDFPLKASVNTVNYHLALLSESELHCQLETSSTSTDNLQKIKYVFILLQSEFLRQLCLCFSTSLWTRDCYKSISDVFQRLVDFNSKYIRLYTNLKSAFDVHYLHNSLPRENRRDDIDSNWLYAEAYLKLCSVSSNLRSVLCESRSLEEYLENIKISNDVPNDVANLLDRRSEEIIAKYAQCAPFIDDFRKCIARLRPKQIERIEPTIPVLDNLPTTNQKSILLGVTDFSPNGPDEVFIGVSESIKQIDDRDTDVTDVVTQRCSKLLINELKVALKDKAKEWKERERAALQRKNEDGSDADLLADFENNDDEIVSRKEKKRVHFEPMDIPSNTMPVTESSFAKQIAAVSASWGLQEEEFFDYEQEEELTDHEQEDENI